MMHFFKFNYLLYLFGALLTLSGEFINDSIWKHYTFTIEKIGGNGKVKVYKNKT